MNKDFIRHNIEFVARSKPTTHPINKHLFAIDTRGMPADLFQDLQQALLDVGVRYHLQAIKQGQLLCFDRAAFELLQDDTALPSVSVQPEQVTLQAAAE